MSAVAANGLVMYVAYHAEGPHPVGISGYQAVCNLAPGGSRPGGFDTYDDDGFPAKNDRYCELSTLRHLERNADSQFVGLCHYRRIFVTRRSPLRYAPRSYVVRRWDWEQPERQGADVGALGRAAGTADWCTTPTYDVRWAGHRSLEDQFLAHHPGRVLDVLSAVMAELYPDLAPFDSWMRRTTRLAFFNMLIARLDRVRDYCDFLWPVLDEVDVRVQHLADPYQGRYPGFLAERLHGYWLEHVAPQGMVVREIPVALLDAPGALPPSAVSRPTVAGPLSGGRLRQDALLMAPFAVRAVVNRAARRSGITSLV